MDKSILKATEDQADTRFGGYTILEHLGKGGMGDVYKATQNGLDRVVALKILPSLLARSQEFSERFFSEAYAISRLQHQNIVTIYDYGEENGQKFIAMQFIQGVTLSKLIHEEKKLDYSRIIGITKQIGRGLKYAHQNDIVHRDIKSGNIMVQPGDKVYISDFGIAKVIDSPGITTVGMAMGTPEYMAPEQCEGGVVDGQSDIYALGCILFEMVTGRPPFLAETPLAVAYKQVHESAPLLSKKVPDMPPRLELIVAKCLKKSKEERYRNADELLRDLDSAHLDLDPAAHAAGTAIPPDSRITDRRGSERRVPAPPLALSRAYLAGILGLFALILGALAYLLLRPAPKPAEGIRWIRPVTFERRPFQANQGAPARAEMPVQAMFDGDRSTAWTFPGGTKTEGEIRVNFQGAVSFTGLVIEIAMSSTAPTVKPNQSASGEKSLGTPRTLVVEAEGQKPLRFNLMESGHPQYLPLDGLIAASLRLRFQAGAGSVPDKPTGIREMRFLGLPYE